MSKLTNRNRVNWLLCALLLALLSACQTLPQPPNLNGYGQASAQLATFKHLHITKPGQGERLHVYIEGDGVPFYHRIQIAADPTPSYPMMLAMMKQDPAPSLYLGRPCYFTRNLPGMEDARCNAHYWTNARYSEEVVTSMVPSLRNYLRGRPAQGITLIGHSGGGTLATLMATRMPEIDQLVTIAANFDTQAWTRMHGYSSLNLSLNPATQTAPIARHQIHYAGSKDDNIPTTLGEQYLSKQGMQYRVIPGNDHNCCWQSQWPHLLQDINAQLLDH